MATVGEAGPRVKAAGISAASTPRVTLAMRLRALDRPLTSYYLVLTASLLLVGLGLVMVLSASSVESYKNSGSVFSIVQKQAIWVCLGLPLMWITSRMSATMFRRLAFPAMFVSLAGLAAVLVPGVGHEVNGNRNWIYLGGPIQVQPSEAAKLALVLFGATVLARKQRLLDRWSHLMIPLVPMSVGVVFLVMLGGDLGTTVVLLAILLALLFFAGTPMRFFGFAGAVAGGLVLFLVYTEPYRMRRVTSFMDPFATYHDSGWQGAQSIFALSSGGLTGVGLGASREKWGYLPEAHTDFIYAIIGEELGLVGSLGVLALFAALVFAGFRIASRSRDMFVTLAAASITAWIAVQALVNIGAVLGVLPITGIPLPLVSYGGSALLPVMAALGILLSFARQEPGAQAALAARGPGPVRRGLAWLGFSRSPRT
ncbi:putative lipid II flippase FtsW [Sporichthya sp.]|uniref:putative lipid II flippase FtsW n=1 Tax=Sporichthya sp. TaxID=65475 RepID=UPI001857202B|nr:putative lipid II flippase FtsW [Sporichthya sp.]MBA3743138.1 putative lipid II flippase FtsW [Sporichthya sp.]